MQKGPCAFSQACVIPGPRVRLEFTGLEFCQHHGRMLGLPAGEAPELAGTRAVEHHYSSEYDLGRTSAGPWIPQYGIFRRG